MPESLPSVHHVVFCVRPENQDAAARLWTDLGFTLTEINLEEEGLRVLLDWNRGVEIISPTASGGDQAVEVERFLAEHGEGVYSVVVRTADVDAAVSVAERHGSATEYRQDRVGPGFSLTEARHAPLFGMPVTFLTTDLGQDAGQDAG